MKKRRRRNTDIQAVLMGVGIAVSLFFTNVFMLYL